MDPHITMLSQNAATLEWLPPPKPSEAATGRYTRPVYHVYLANTTDQPYPVLLTTVHRPSYILTNLTPSTTYTVQVVAENTDGVSFRNSILRFHTKSEEDNTVSRHDEGGGASSVAISPAPPLAELVPFHGPRAAPSDDHAGFMDSGVDVADIPTAVQQSMKSPTPPASRRRRGRRGGSSGRANVSSAKRKASRGRGPANKRGTPGAPGSAAGKRKHSTRSISSSSSGAKQSSSVAAKQEAAETLRETRPSGGSFLPPLAKTF